MKKEETTDNRMEALKSLINNPMEQPKHVHKDKSTTKRDTSQTPTKHKRNESGKKNTQTKTKESKTLTGPPNSTPSRSSSRQNDTKK